MFFSSRLKTSIIICSEQYLKNKKIFLVSLIVYYLQDLYFRKIYIYIYIYIYIFIYITFSKNLSAKYYQENKERLQKKACRR